MASATGERIGALMESVDRQPVTASREIDAGARANDDSRLVEAARAGDRAAFGELYGRYARMVHGILLARVPLNEVDDLVHDTFLQALRRLHTLRDCSRFGAWLAAITRNRANDFHRQSVAEVELPEELSEDSPVGHSAGLTLGGNRQRDEDEEEARFLLSVIRELPETYREPLLLRLVEGMTGPEIAARTGLTPGSVRVNLHRGMQQLREKLARSSRASPASSA
jgi:RNA polymerase sigma-70 factor (ECF subfamily)